MRCRLPQNPLDRIPLYAFAFFYFVTFVCGAALLLWGPEAFVSLFKRSVGIAPFWLSAEDVFVDWILIIVAPLGFVAGWILGSHRSPVPPGSRRESRSPGTLFYGALYALLGIVGLVSLKRTGAGFRVHDWLDYGALIQTRLLLLERMTFAEWANLYVLLPTAAGLLLVSLRRSPLTRVRAGLAIALVGLSLVMLDLLLFQKRYVILSAIFLGTCVLMSRPNVTVSGQRMFTKYALGGAALYLLYCTLVVAPSIRPATALVQLPPTSLFADMALAAQAPRQERRPEVSTPLPQGGVRPATQIRPVGYYTEIRFPALRALVERCFPGRWIGRAENSTRTSDPYLARLLFAALSPAMRTAPPALAYPMLFPRKLPFFGLDVGLDVSGMGRMPDDNLVVYAAMYGQIGKGASSVPFQFAWFSQVGLAGAVLLSSLLGFAVACAWTECRNMSLPAELRAVLCALIVLFCVHITQDSVRGGLINSYGVVWGVLLVAGIAAAVPALTRHMPDRSSSD